MSDGKAVKVIDLYKVIKNKCDEIGTRCSMFLDDQPNVVSYHQYMKSYCQNIFVYRKRISPFTTIKQIEASFSIKLLYCIGVSCY